MILLEPAGTGTRYTAIGMHSNEGDKEQHEKLGFSHGWNAALDQLVAHMKGQK
jgi:hypothetical protein